MYRRASSQWRSYTIGLYVHIEAVRTTDTLPTCEVNVRVACTWTHLALRGWCLIYYTFRFSERELTFTFAICYRPSVCRLSVTFVHPTQPVEIFGNVSSPFGTLTIRWHPRKILQRSPQGTPPLGGGVNAREVAKYSDLWSFRRPYLIGSRIWAFDWYQNRWPWMTLNDVMALILRYFTEVGGFRGALRKMVDQAITIWTIYDYYV